MAATTAAATIGQAIPKVINASVVLFPGQGSQCVGMVQNLTLKGKGLFNIAAQVLGYDLLKLCQEGPEVDLNKTVHSQPAVFVSSLAAVEQLAERSPMSIEKCIATAGFSVGEYAALVFAKSMDFVDALRLIKLRAEATQLVCEETPSGLMTVVLGNDGKIGNALKMAHEYCIRSGMSRDESVCSIANYLFPHARVIGGHEKALEFIEIHGKDFGIRRIKRLAVSGAFHTNIMKPAYQDLKLALSKIEIKQPVIDVYSNTTGKKYQNVQEIRDSLAKHIFRPVLWEQSIHNLYSDAMKDGEMPITFECGPQNNMTTILGMINMTAKKQSFNVEP